jgi:AcrR family transcriptional regulator
MSSLNAEISPAATRRQPVQRRSRERVELILAAAEEIVVEEGVAALSTRTLARRARLPVGSVYTYFDDRDAIMAALMDRHMRAVQERMEEDVQALACFSIRSIVETVVAGVRAGYALRPSFVVLWHQGALSQEAAASVRARIHLLADQLCAFAIEAGLIKPDTDPFAARFSADMLEAVMATAYRDSLAGDDAVVREGIEMIVRYLMPIATPTGVAGVPASELLAALLSARV